MTKNIMIQGTMSGVGKSILTAGILRVLSQDGYRCAPFKSQNMALNSFVTQDGKEMGRAQVVQAAACYKEPSVDMNPILLKPTGQKNSQVIVQGKPIGDYSAHIYFKEKMKYMPVILDSYHRLEENNDIIVIEGAGSPVEINLRQTDIVNMGLAEKVNAPVLLVGNIDPGGVFAQLLGTVELLSPKERKRVKGLIINQFRGDVSLLMPGLELFASYCSVPFAGIVPYISLDLEEEDSLSKHLQENQGKNADIEIAVIALPYMSNYTDFSNLSRAGAHVYYAHTKEALKQADLIVLPGTKNTIYDLKWIQKQQFSEYLVHTKQPILGICGGFQILGQTIQDENGQMVEGLHLLPIDTIFYAEKLTRQISGTTPMLMDIWQPFGNQRYRGYEIHMGISKDMIFCQNKNVLGTYVHGLFDKPNMVSALFRVLGKHGQAITDAFSYQDAQLNKLADVLRKHLNWTLIYKAIGV